jgi:geranylgeranyl diphosphate synthase type I
MDAIAELGRYKKKVDLALEQFFSKKLAESKKIDSVATEMVSLLKEYTLRGGKRIRPALVYYGYRCVSDKDLKEVVKASLSVEFLQSFLLIHDDIIDCSNLRRGKLTMHKIYESIYKNPVLGTSMAIIAGDLASAYANEAIATAKLKQKNKTDAIASLNRTLAEVIFGQALDILFELKPGTKEYIELVHRFKTASYTMEGPLHIGAILGGADEKQLKLLSKYAIPLGKAFQLQDDILGMFSTEQELGKPVDSDLKEGKKTLLIIKALENATPKQKKTIQNALGNKNLTKKQFESVREIIKETGSLNHSQKIAKDLITQAKTPIEKSNFKAEAKEFLIGIADYMLERKY